MSVGIENIKEALALVGVFTDDKVYDWLPLVGGIILFSLVIFILNSILASFRAIKEYQADGLMLQVKGSYKTADMGAVLRRIHEIFYKKYRHRVHIAVELVLKKDTTYLFLYIPQKMHQSVTEGLQELNYQVDIVNDKLEEFFDTIKSKGHMFTGELMNDFVWPLEFDRQESGFRKSLSKGDFLYFQVLLRPVSSKWRNIVDDYRKKLMKGVDPLKSRGLAFFSKPSQEEERFDLDQKVSMITKKISDVGFEIAIRGVIFSKTNQEPLLCDRFQEVLTTSNEIANSITFQLESEHIVSSQKPDFLVRFLDDNTVDILNEIEVARLIEYLYN